MLCTPALCLSDYTTHGAVMLLRANFLVLNADNINKLLCVLLNYSQLLCVETL